MTSQLRQRRRRGCRWRRRCRWRGPQPRHLHLFGPGGARGPAGDRRHAGRAARAPRGCRLAADRSCGRELVGSLAWTWRPAAPEHAATVVISGLVAAGVPLTVAAALPPSGLPVTAVLFAVSGFSTGPLFGALLLTRHHHAPAAARTQMFTSGLAQRSLPPKLEPPPPAPSPATPRPRSSCWPAPAPLLLVCSARCPSPPTICPGTGTPADRAPVKRGRRRSPIGCLLTPVYGQSVLSGLSDEAHTASCS